MNESSRVSIPVSVKVRLFPMETKRLVDAAKATGPSVYRQKHVDSSGFLKMRVFEF